MNQYSDSELKFIQSKFGLTDIEMDVFMSAAHRYGLNPLANQIYPQIRNDRKSGNRTMVIATGIDGYRTLADRTGCYAGNDDPVFDDPDGPPKKATVTVYKVVGGVRCPFSATARWDQYVPQENMAFMWRRMPHLMLGKVAEALALRKAFPAAMSGIYTTEEMDQAGPAINIEAEKQQAPATSQAKSPPQRPVPKQDKKSKDETPKERFVRLVGEWTGLSGKDLHEKCKSVMSAHDVRTDGKAEPADFICCLKFVEKFMSQELSIDDAVDAYKAERGNKSDSSEEEAEF
jgi:phage recombination protein Bet